MLQSELEAMLAKIEKLEIEKRELEARNSSLQAVIVAKDTKITKKNSLITQLKSEEESKSVKIEKLEKEVETTASSLQVVIRAKTAKITEQENLLNSLVENNQSLTKAVDMLREAKENERMELELTKSSLREAIATNASLVKNIESLTKSVETVETLKEVKENPHITETTIRARINDVANLSDTCVSSRSTLVAGIDWCIRVGKDDDHLKVYLKGEKPNAAKWSCPVFFDLQLISQKDEKVVHHLSTVYYTFDEIKSWGFLKFISFKDLFDEEKGYVMDDSILLSATIRAFPSN